MSYYHKSIPIKASLNWLQVDIEQLLFREQVRLRWLIHCDYLEAKALINEAFFVLELKNDFMRYKI